jgi:CDP-glucose 4,6-dehydratase
MGTLITGISGFLGGRLAARLAARGETVAGLARRPPDTMSETVAFYPVDLADAEAVRRVIERVRPRTVFHFGAVSFLQAGAGADGPLPLFEANVRGTWNLLDACRRTDVPAVVVASSDKQYGALAASPYDDSDSGGFISGGVYALTKSQQDQIVRLYAGLYDVPALRIARLVNIYGPGDTQWTRIVSGTMRRLIEGQAPRLTAGPAGAAEREYVFVDDALDAIEALAHDASVRGNAPLRRETDGQLARIAFNVGCEHRHTAAAVIAACRAALSETCGIVGPASEVLPGIDGVFEGGSQATSTERLRTIVPDWNPRPLDAGLRETAPWFAALWQR